MATVIKPKRREVALSIPKAGELTAGEIALNVTDGKFYSKTVAGVVKEVGGAGSATLGDIASNGATIGTDVTLDGANLVFEGFLANAYEKFVGVGGPSNNSPSFIGYISTTSGYIQVLKIAITLSTLNS